MVWRCTELVVDGPVSPTGISRAVPCRPGCNLTALQHSFEMSLLHMAVAVRHVVLHDKYQVASGGSASEAVWTRSAKKWPNLNWLPNWQLFCCSNYNATGRSQATRDIHPKGRLVASQCIDVSETDVLHGQLQRLIAYVKIYLCRQSGQHQASMGSLRCLGGGEMRMAMPTCLHDFKVYRYDLMANSKAPLSLERQTWWHEGKEDLKAGNG